MSLFANLIIEPTSTSKPAVKPYIFNNTKVSLKYKTPRDKGNRFAWWRDHQITEKALNVTDKRSQALMSMWPTQPIDGAQTRVATLTADFDEVPEGFTSFDHFYDWCLKNTEITYVGRTQSGKVKIFYPVQFEGYMNEDFAVYLLNHFLPIELKNKFDTCTSALTTVYINKSIDNVLKELVKSKPIILPNKNSPEFADFITKIAIKANQKFAVAASAYLTLAKNIKKKPYKKHLISRHDVTLPKCVQSFVGKPDSKGYQDKLNFSKLILSAKNLMDVKGFGLSQHMIAEQLKINPATVNRYIKKFIELNLLEVVDGNWKMLTKAIRYRVKYKLMTHMKQFFDKLKKSVKPAKILKSVVSKPGQNYMYIRANVSKGINWIKDNFHKGVKAATIKDAVRICAWYESNRKVLV
jgi:predicted transcriptional regulator